MLEPSHVHDIGELAHHLEIAISRRAVTSPRIVNASTNQTFRGQFNPLCPYPSTDPFYGTNLR
jgi:hypothetical protein